MEPCRTGHPAGTRDGGRESARSRHRESGRDVLRFGPTERAFHWSFAIPFLGMLLSGLPRTFPTLRSWIDGYTPEIGLRLHLVCAGAWVLAPVLVVVLGDRAALAIVAGDLFVILKQEWLWVRRLPRWLLGLPCEMDGVGRFNAGQKLNALFVAVISVALAVTGVILWIAWQWPGLVGTRESVAGRILAWSRNLHVLITLLMLAPLLGHILLATVHPRTRASLRGMLLGVVDAEWAREHHPEWYAKVGRLRAATGRSEGHGSSEHVHEGS